MSKLKPKKNSFSLHVTAKESFKVLQKQLSEKRQSDSDESSTELRADRGAKGGLGHSRASSMSSRDYVQNFMLYRQHPEQEGQSDKLR